VASSPQSFNKRQRERAKKEKAALKRERRQSKPEDGDDTDGPLDEDAILERFRVLNERHAAGTVTVEDFEAERQEIFVLLGLGES
jgi:hypothetical protein